ncbi:MAG: nucleoside hydrolase [Prolixibacteraceae bacterium]
MKITVAVFLLIIVNTFLYGQEKKPVIIDADTGNEVDDLYAVVRGVIEPSWHVIGLNATQWQASHWAVDNTMEESYRLNDILLSYLKLSDKIVSNRGATNRLFDWGNKTQTSAASAFIVKEAMKPRNEKLNVIALGALTNVASAILDEPAITDKIRLFWLGTRYDFEEGVMSNIDFNSVMDIQAVDVILNSDVELHIIPGNVSGKMTFDWDQTVAQFEGKHELTDYLLQRWYNHMDAGVRERTIWDLALIQAVIFPEMAEEVKIRTSKERGDRIIRMYKNIDAEKMRDEFFKTTLDYLDNLK